MAYGVNTAEEMRMLRGERAMVRETTGNTGDVSAGEDGDVEEEVEDLLCRVCRDRGRGC
jgi:hypothetical protein